MKDELPTYVLFKKVRFTEFSFDGRSGIVYGTPLEAADPDTEYVGDVTAENGR